MDNMFLVAGVVFAVVGLVAMFAVYGIYGGVHGTLSTARVGEVYNFLYNQPLHGEPERFMARVVDIHTLDDNSIRRLNARSAYRKNDPEFFRTRHLVTAQTPDGRIRNFYAERCSNVRRPILAPALFKTGLAQFL
jgi:hypothetical protein